jgi:tRNA(His) 5'-end guanylyltransferase
VFDARAFNIPLEEVPNYFLWRAKDWERNSVQMLARSRFSQKELHGKDRAKMLTMLEAEGIRWNELPDHLKNGTYIMPLSPEDRILVFKDGIRPCFEDLSATVAQALTKPEKA